MASSSFVYSSFSEVPAYPEHRHYHDWRDALYQLDFFPMSNGEAFDIGRYKTKSGTPAVHYFGEVSHLLSNSNIYF